jgi:endonuclease/exonuclease/phosphatase family metal-dependent hydrolase
MIYRAEKLYRQIKRFSSSNRFIVWLFGMSKASNKDHQRGLIILQIDGLSHKQFRVALESGAMPFLNSLLNHEHSHLNSLYSGIPSSTPAVQGELFYGVRGCVPAFKFKRPQDDKPVHMLDINVASDIEKDLNNNGSALFKGGSVYSDLFTGGAAESSFCASSLGWDSIIPSRNVYKMVLFAALNIVSVVRVIFLTVLELFMAVFDFFRGIIDGRNLLKELGFVPVRVGVSVLLRELVTIGVKLDAARGLPVIHANFLGYDEQSHRRGPSSKFAHWSLRGLDKVISRIWYSAKHSEHRDYDIWIYSDHGQEATRCYPIEFSTSIETEVNDAVARFCNAPINAAPNHAGETLAHSDGQRIKLLGSKKISAWLARKEDSMERISNSDIQVAAMGPLGLVYIDHQTTFEQHKKIAHSLVEYSHVPMAMVADFDQEGDRIVHVERADGHCLLPADKERVFGSDHPFLDDLCVDMINTVHHEFAGKITLCGWHVGQAPMSFRIENGAHGGPGEQETHAFALIPEDTVLPERDRNYLRFIDLHHAARAVLDNEVAVREPLLENFAVDYLKPKGCLRVMTYNIHSCIGMDGKVAPRRLARIISRYSPDIIALQEVDADRASSQYIDQAIVLAAELNMNMHYHPVRFIDEEQFGNAILSRHPMRLIDASPLATNVSPFRSRMPAVGQPRGALLVEVDVEGQKFTMINTHLGVTPEERKTQVSDLLGEPRFSENRKPIIVCGDFNAVPNQYAYLEVKKKMNDVQLEVNKGIPKKTFPSRYPTLRIDHMFVDKDVDVVNVFVPSNHMTKVASDHLPLIADLRIT